MIDHARHIEGIVKDELAKACTARGIDKSEAGYAVGGFGQISLIIVGPGQMSPMPAWTVLVSLRNLLIGMPPVADSAPAPGILPTDDQFRQVVQLLVKTVDEQRQAAFKGESPNGQINPFEVKPV